MFWVLYLALMVTWDVHINNNYSLLTPWGIYGNNIKPTMSALFLYEIAYLLYLNSVDSTPPPCPHPQPPPPALPLPPKTPIRRQLTMSITLLLIKLPETAIIWSLLQQLVRV